MPNQGDLFIDYGGVEGALYQLKKQVYSCMDASHDAQRMTEDQTRAKWGTESAAVTFSKRYHEFLTKLRDQINQWQDDLTTFVKRVDQAQEVLRDASETEAATIDQMR